MGKGQAIGEGIFDIFYLVTVYSLGFIMFMNSKDNDLCRTFSLMTLILGFGDSFHLVPRVYSLATDGLQNHPKSLGFGKFLTSITMTIFYVIMNYFIDAKYNIQDKMTTNAVLILATIRILLCFLPQNKWFSTDAPVYMNYIRNIPFVILGGIIIYRFYQVRDQDPDFRLIWFAILLSFSFYIPVFMFAHFCKPIGMLMIPKTCAYLWIVFTGYNHFIKGTSLATEL